MNRRIWQTINVILRSQIGHCVFNPTDEQWLAAKATSFQGAYPSNPIAVRCVGCVDGLAIEIQCPYISDGVKDFSNRKGFYAIVWQGIYDAECRFLLFDCSSPGSTYDSIALSLTSLFPHLCDGLPANYYIVGDAAYPLVGSILKPFQGWRRNCWEDSFNYHLSAVHVNIKNVFGIFIQRWGIFWRCLQYSPVQSTKIIMCCAFLHNFIITHDGVKRAQRLKEKGIEHEAFTFWQDQLATQSGLPPQP